MKEFENGPHKDRELDNAGAKKRASGGAAGTEHAGQRKDNGECRSEQKSKRRKDRPRAAKRAAIGSSGHEVVDEGGDSRRCDGNGHHGGRAPELAMGSEQEQPGSGRGNRGQAENPEKEDGVAERGHAGRCLIVLAALEREIDADDRDGKNKGSNVSRDYGKDS